jgi:hypothetical protein
MPRDMASLLSMPMTPTPADADASTHGADQAGGGLQSLMQRPGGAPGGGGGAPGMGAPAPDNQTTVAAIRHLGEFQRRWKTILETPNIGKVDVKGQVIEAMADLLGESFISLPQSLTLLKSLPTDPLQQRQWIEKHYADDQKAAVMLLQHHAAAFPRDGSEPLPPRAPRDAKNHVSMMSGLSDHYKARSPRGRQNA